MHVNPEKRIERLEAAALEALTVAAHELGPPEFQRWWTEHLARLAPAERAMVTRTALRTATDEEILAEVRLRRDEEPQREAEAVNRAAGK